jgi:putative ABC transport system permease protein
MSTPWRKALRDVWRERTRTVLVVLAIALGITGFSAVLSSYAVLTRELDQGYLATNPPSAILRTDAIDDDLVAAVRADPAVAAAEPRRVVSGRIKAGPVEWRQLMLFVVKDYADIRVGTLAPGRGAWPPGPGEILIERDAMGVARAQIGDMVTIRIAGGEPRTLRVSGTVKDVGQAQARMENIVYGYATLDTLVAVGEKRFLDQLMLVVAENRFDESHVRRVTEGVRALIERRGHPVRRVDVPRPGKHPHADLMDTLLALMAGFGLLVLALSGILVVNLMAAVMAAQARQVAVMQAIGGSRWQIARIYLAQALLLGAGAILVGLPGGILGSRVLCRQMGVFLNFDILSFAVPAWVWLLVAGVGIVVPVLAAAHPVWKGSRVPIRAALADFGVARTGFGTGRLDRAVARVGGRARPLLLALRNCFRRRTRLVLTVVTLAAAGVFFMTAVNVRAALIQTLDRQFAGRRYDLSVILGGMQPFADVEQAVRGTPGVRRVEGWIATEAAVATTGSAPADAGRARDGAPGGGLHGGRGPGLHGGSGGGIASDRFTVLAVPATTAMLSLDVDAGRALAADENDTLVANTALAARFPQFRVGARVTLRMGPADVEWRVVGCAREPFSPAVAYVPLAFFEQPGLHPGMTNSLRLALDRTDAAAIQEVRAGLDRDLERAGIRAHGSTSQAESRYGFDQHMLMIYVFLLIMAGVIAGVGGLGLMTTMSLNVLERRREMGVLRTIGATSPMVWFIVVAEGTLIGVASWAVAAVVAWPAGRLLGDAMVALMFRGGLASGFEPLGVLAWLGISIVLSAAASFVPAWHAARRPVREAVGWE